MRTYFLILLAGVMIVVRIFRSPYQMLQCLLVKRVVSGICFRSVKQHNVVGDRQREHGRKSVWNLGDGFWSFSLCVCLKIP